jgi:chromosome segregation ATPase
MTERTVDDRFNMLAQEMLHRQLEASKLRSDLSAAQKRLEKLEARYFEADEERSKLGPRCDKAEEELTALRREHEVMFKAGFTLPPEDGDLGDVVQEWLASARDLDRVVDEQRKEAGKGDPGFDVQLLETRATAMRECAARLQRCLKKRGEA